MLQLKKIIVLLMIVFGFQLSSAQVNILNAKVAGDIGVKTEAQIILSFPQNGNQRGRYLRIL